MSGIIGSKFNIRGSGLVASLGTDGQLFTSSGAGVSQVFEAAPAASDVSARQDVITLALKLAVQENSTKHNLTNSSIVQFQADGDYNSGGSTNVNRHASEYLWAAATTTTQAGITKVGSPVHDTAQYKYGSSSISTGTDNSDYLHWDLGATAMDVGTGAWTIEFWMRFNGFAVWNPPFQVNAAVLTQGGSFVDMISSDITNSFYYRVDSPSISAHDGRDGNEYVTAADTWHHHAIVRAAAGTTDHWYVNGVERQNNTIGSGAMFNMRYGWIGYSNHTQWMDDFRISNTARYTGTFTPPTRLSSDSNTKFLLQSIDQDDDNGTFVDTGDGIGTSITQNATGTALGTTNVPSSAVTEVSGVLLLKNEEGTASLGTDIKVYFTADNSNFTEASSYADAGTFSTGIKMIRLGKTTVTSGSDVRWKIVWANQSDGSKESEVWGIGLNY